MSQAFKTASGVVSSTGRWAPLCLLACAALATEAQGTKQWNVNRFEDFERGTPNNVAIRNDGRLEPAPVLRTLATTSASYLWCVLPQPNGGALVGTGAASGGSHMLRVDGKGASTNIADFKELNVQALAVEASGSILAATSPDGKVYRIAAGANTKPEVVFDASATAEKPKYLWAIAVERSGDVLVAAGAPAVLYRVPRNGGKAQVVFQSGDQHLRTLLLAPDGTIYVGSDGAGIVYRVGTDGKPFALFAAPRHEITSLALDTAGNLYVAGTGDQRPVTLPPLAATGEPRVPVALTSPLLAIVAPINTPVPDGSEIYRIAPDGTPLKLLTLRDELVYTIGFRRGSLFAATGNHGHVYRLDTAQPGVYTDVAHVEASQATALAQSPDGLLLATANSGKLLSLADAAATDASYTSDVFDGEVAAQWGRAELTGTRGNIDFFARSGNVSNVHGALGDLWSPWKPVSPDQTPLPVPVARYLQWKAVLHPGAQLDAVAVNYLPRNLPPSVEDIVVQPGARVSPQPPAQPSALVPVAFRSASNAAASVPAETIPGPLLAQRDRNAVTVRWIARDPNGDDLMFAVYARGIGEQNWRLLKDKLSERAYSFDSGLLPDGQYEIRVVASDAPVHADADTLTAERISAPFVIDTTPPVPGPLSATIQSGKLTATFSARDATSPITHAEFSVDGGPWQYLEPVGKLSDSLEEHYSIKAAIAGPGEHTLAVRVFDRNENAVSVKAVAR